MTEAEMTQADKSDEDLVAHALDCARRAGADAADALLIRGRSMESRVRGEVIDFVKQAQEQVLGIRALRSREGGMSSAVTSTCDLAPEAIEAMAADAVTLAKATAADPAAGLPDGGFATQLPELRLVDPDDRTVSIEARIDDARRCESAARGADARIVNSEGSQASSSFSTVAYGNSAGFLGQYESAYHSLFSEPIASDASGMQRDYWMTVGRHLSSLEAPEAVGRQAAERSLRRLAARRVPTCEAPVLFEPRPAASLLGQLLSLVSGYAVYREASFLADRLGEVIASPGFTLVDDGQRPGGLGSKPFDGEGLPTRRNVIVDDGRLATWLLDSYSGRKLGFASTGSASRGPGSTPGVGATNLWLEPGDVSLAEMIAATDRGLLVTELIGMGFNPVTGDYSRGAAGLWIEKGKIQYPVEEITIAGNFGDMLKAVDMIGSELLWLGSVAAPPLRIASMTIAGE
ncbi:MAG: TldD/PmbA family protein [Deltaproteobacteria bacterium]|nr:TldD/PmbA family protein [Deltaproteobacteria bacterium]